MGGEGGIYIYERLEGGQCEGRAKYYAECLIPIAIMFSVGPEIADTTPDIISNFNLQKRTACVTNMRESWILHVTLLPMKVSHLKLY